MRFSSCSLALQTPGRHCSLKFCCVLPSTSPETWPGPFAQPLPLHTSSLAGAACRCTSSVTGERYRPSRPFIRRLASSVALQLAASKHYRQCFPSSLLAINAEMACSLFFLCRTLFLPPDSTPLHAMSAARLPLLLSLARLIVHPDSFSKVLDTVISTTVTSPSHHSLATHESVQAAPIAPPSFPRPRYMLGIWRAFHKSLPNYLGHQCSCGWKFLLFVMK